VWPRVRAGAGLAFRAPRRRGRLLDRRLGECADRNVGLAGAHLTFNDHLHVQLRAQLKANRLPRAPVVTDVDGAANVHALAHRPILLEVRVVANDGRRIRPDLLPNLVRAAVAGQAAILCRADVVGRVVVTHRLDHVVLYERVLRPAVQCKVRGTGGLEVTCVVDKTGGWSVSQSLFKESLAA
jgi:hypothetical protein